MKFIVTGGSGFIGSQLIRNLLYKGEEVLNIDALTYAAVPGTLNNVESNSKYSFQKMDVCDPNIFDVISGYKPDRVYHLAAESHVDNSLVSTAPFLKTNVNGTVNILEAVYKYWVEVREDENFRMFHISTDEVFGTLQTKDDNPFDHNSIQDPSSPYSASKAAADNFVNAWAVTHQLPVFTTYCTNNYGPYQHPEKFIPKAIINTLLGLPVPVYGDGQNIRTWTHVEDHAWALYDLSRQEYPHYKTYISSGKEKTNLEILYELATIIRAKTGKQMTLQFVQDRPGHDTRYAMVNTSEQEQYYTLSMGLKETVDFYVENKWWWEQVLFPEMYSDPLVSGPEVEY